VVIRLVVRRFFCAAPDCAAARFAARIDGLASRYARRSLLLAALLLSSARRALRLICG
jgi:hypothetical protein